MATRETVLSEAKALFSDGFLTVNEAAEFLKMSRGAIYGMMARGEVSYVRVGRLRRVPRSALEEFLRRGLVSATA